MFKKLTAPTLTKSSATNIVPFKQPQPRYFKLHKSTLDSTNWQSMGAVDRAIFIAVVGRFDGFNNGKIRYGITEARAEFRIGHPKADRAFNNLEERKLAIRRQRGTFDFDVKAARDTKWELTPLALGSQVGPNTNPLDPAARRNISRDSKSKERRSFRF